MKKEALMSKQAEADLILKLYELRRDDTMRKARDWCFRDFHPDSIEDVTRAYTGEHSAYLRMVSSYWDMAAAMVNYGAISQELFTETNGEYYAIFAKLEPFLKDIRAALGPYFLRNLEQLVEATPGGRERVSMIRERMKLFRAQTATTGKR
jgi:hypothetical protein